MELGIGCCQDYVEMLGGGLEGCSCRLEKTGRKRGHAWHPHVQVGDVQMYEWNKAAGWGLHSMT